MKKPKKPIKLGRYQLGHEMMEVVLTPGSESGAVDFHRHSKGASTTITIGIGCPLWEAYGTLLHEAMEVVSDISRLRYKNASSFNTSSDSYSFHMDHNQYSEVCAKVGAFLHDVMKDFNKAYKKHHA